MVVSLSTVHEGRSFSRPMVRSGSRNSSGNLALHLLSAISERINLSNLGGSLLEIGCGDGRLLEAMSPTFSDALGIDLSLSPTLTRRVPKYVEGDFQTYQFDEGHRFNLIIAGFSVHHFRIETALRKMKALVRPGGQIIIVDLHAEKRSSLFAYLLDQFIFSHIADDHRRGLPTKHIGLNASLRLYWARMLFVLQRTGLAHVREDLRRQRPPSLCEWNDWFSSSLCGGSFERLAGPVFMYSWTAPKSDT